jgi:complement component 1 Q subcomponent-binding protein
LGQELDYEISNEEESKWLSDFQKDTPFTLVDASGQKEFKLTRSFGNEKITVLCNIDSVQFPEEFDEPVPEEESQLSLDLVVLIEKSSGTQDLGTMELKVTLDNNDFFIEHVGYSGNSALMAADSAEAEHARDTLYGGPVFEELAESVKDVFHQYLEERGFNAELADFLSRYAQHKEQQEYVSWLKQVKGFIAQ